MSKKSTINRDTLLIVQVFVLILIILLIINQIDTFKNNKTNHKHAEGFVDNQKDTVKLYIGKQYVRLGDLSKILNKDDGVLTTNFNINTLITYNLYNDDTTKTSNYFRTNSITHITIEDGYSVIVYDGNNFDNNKRSILINGSTVGEGDNKTPAIIDLYLSNYNFKNKLSSIKVFKVDDKDDVLKREANYNNQILLFSEEAKSGDISRINLPTEKMTTELEIEYYYPLQNNDKSIKPIYDVIIPGSKTTQNNRDGVHRNINLELTNSSENEQIIIIKDTQYLSPNELKNIKHYKIIPQVATLDTFTALSILNNNMVELESLKNEFKDIKKEQIDNNTDIQNNQMNVVNELSNSFINKIQKQNNKYNYKLHTYMP
jgi:hypothetical protein